MFESRGYIVQDLDLSTIYTKCNWRLTRCFRNNSIWNLRFITDLTVSRTESFRSTKAFNDFQKSGSFTYRLIYNNCPLWTEHRLRVDSKGFGRWCITLRITGFLDFAVVRNYKYEITRSFRNWMFPALREGRVTPTLLGPLESSNLNHWTSGARTETLCWVP
jgi:hypothetical protein